jgi:ABC-type nitrate/sulfonate/bicarbonate transport system substrate-binding protein
MGDARLRMNSDGGDARLRTAEFDPREDIMARRSFMALSARVALGALAGATILVAPPTAQAQTPVKVMVFPGLSNLSIFAAEHKNLFAKHGLAIELINTPSSDVQRERLAKGEIQIAQAAVDNAVAMVELAKADAIIVTGGDNGYNRIMVQGDISSFADLRGRTVAVDAPNTAYALVLYKVLKDAGLNKGDYKVNPVGGTPARLEAMIKDKSNAAGIINIPFSFRGQEAGLKDMGSAAKAIGAYQADGAFVMRAWAQANSDTLIRYIKAFVEGRRWLLDPANKAEVVKLLADRLRLAPDVAERTYRVATDPVDGVARDAKFDMDGFKNVLKLRAEIEGQWGGTPPPPDKFIDLSYYAKAIAAL